MGRIKSIFIVLLVTFLSNSLFAQMISVNGTVSDENGEVLPGVNIVVKGTTNGVITDFDGNYTIKTDANSVLVYSFIGLESKDVEVNGKTVINIVLLADSEQVEEVIITAFGTSTKEAFTGSASVVGSEKMESRPVASLDQALQGASANVRVSTSTGQPGTSASVTIRGVGSLSASSEPLYVVDGVPLATSLGDINPNDIEKMTVLKDAAATSLYGSRAANGVIMITTKSGSQKIDQLQFTFSVKTGITNRISDGYDLMNAEQYYQHSYNGLYNKAFIVDGVKNEAEAHDYAAANIEETVGFNPYSTDQPFTSDGDIAANTTLLYSTDWRDAVYQQGFKQDYSLSVASGSEKGSFYLSAGYFEEKGIVIGSDFSRFTLKFNTDRHLNKKITVGVRSNLSYSVQNYTATGTSGANPVRNAEVINPVSPIYNADGTYNWDNKASNDYNPVGQADMDIRESIGKYISTSVFSNFELPFNMNFRSTGSIDYTNATNTEYYNPDHGDGAVVNGRSTISRPENVAFNWTNVLSWTKIQGENSYEALGGHEAHYEYYDALSASATNGLEPGNPEFPGYSTPEMPSSGASEWAMISYFGQAKYNYGGKYYTSASVRTDGSSRFGESSRWGVFYSLGGSWRISEESFFNSSWVNNLKLRTSYGTSGNANIGNYQYRALAAYGTNYGGNPGLTPAQLENPNLGWEDMGTFNLALEANIFKNIDLTVEYYNKSSDGLLYAEPKAPSNGYTSIMTNLGGMSNQGVEFTINTTNIKRGNFSWGSNFNAGFNKNELKSLTQDRVLSDPKILEVGGDIGQFYLREYAGVNAENGKPIWYTNVNSDDQATSEEPSSAFVDKKSGRMVTSDYEDAERIRAGSALPSWQGALGNSLSYKGFALDFTFTFSAGNKIYNANYASSMHDGASPTNNVAVDGLNAWAPGNTDTDVPVYITNSTDNGNQLSTRFLEDGDYLRLQNLTFSYSLPSNLVSRWHMSSVRFYATGENLWTLTDYTGFDPEVGMSGISSHSIPATKTWTFGMNVKF